MRTLPFALVGLGFGLGGCVIGSDKYQRPRDLPDEWLVDRVRVLAVQAEPPEAAPGTRVTFRALVPQPGVVDPYLVVWFTCPPTDDGGIGFGCELPDTSAIDATDPEALAELGVIGFEPFQSPEYTIPDDALDGLDDAARGEGLYQLVQVTAFPPSYLEPGGAPEEIDFGEVEAAYKRLVVSEARTPNRNPFLSVFLVDGIAIPEDATLTVEEGQTYELATTVSESLVEEYLYLTDDGTEEWRTEEPYVNWYTTAGTLNESLTLHPYLDVGWVAPESGTSGTFYVVVRDRRGGMAWIQRSFTVL
ncbi:MAG: hypothetical protein H0V89_02385 [Deltaproteobacteria bacterium]|nr:hypothetical protein [Deltaproteobacteria bacterium]